jgi:hypothetical protein
MPLLLWLWLLRHATPRPPEPPPRPRTLSDRYAALPPGPGGSRLLRLGDQWLVILPHRITELECAVVAEFSGDGEPGMSGLYWEKLRTVERDD